MQTASYKITDVKTGEKLRNFSLVKGDLAVCDRAYGTADSVQYCVETGADFLIRQRSNSPKLYDENGKEIKICEKFNCLKEEEIGEFTAFMHGKTGEFIPVRICAKRKSDALFAETVRKLKNNATRHICNLKDSTKEFNRYIVVATSILSDVSAVHILETYRYRFENRYSAARRRAFGFARHCRKFAS